ncbi:general transcription factor 3C polypeptide 3 [Cloeon dipterum]|uniref:general transcription factor 3C polypeptide 3 n=1 Tax=Cloeon dipterum TaxID=197152 RepID=UPI0032204491
MDVDQEFLNEHEAEVAMLVDSAYPEGDEPPQIPQQSTSGTQSNEAEITEDQREEMAARRMNELTQMYLTGKLPFSVYLKTLESNEEVYDEDNRSGADDESSYDDDDKDEDYSPSNKSRVTKKKTVAKREAFCREFDASRRRSRPGRRDLPPLLRSLMGQANLKYTQGDLDVAAKICEEVIRQMPKSPGPYNLLALIQKDKGFHQSGHYYSLIAAHLSSSCGADEWMQLAETSLDFDKKNEALTCLTSAIRSDRLNPDPRLRQIKLLIKMGQSKAVLRARENMVRVIGSNPRCAQQHGRLILLQAKIAAREYHQENNLAKATSIMEAAINACKGSASEDDIHLLVELHCEQNENLKGLDMLRKVYGLDLQPKEPPFKVCHCPTMEPDLRAKLVVFLVRLDVSKELLEPILKMFIKDPREDHGERFLDMVEALMAKGRYKEAMVLMNPLVESEAYSTAAAVWLTRGECLRHLNDLEGAKKSYMNVIKHAPQHIQARLTLSSIYCQMNLHKESLEVLHSDEPEARLLYEEFLLLYQSSPEKCISIAIKLMEQYIKPGSVKEMYELAIIKKKREGFDQEVENGPSSDDLLDVVTKGCDLCMQLKRFREFKRLVFVASHVKPLTPHSNLLNFLVAVSCIRHRDPQLAWVYCRNILFNNARSTYAWHLFGLTCRQLDETRHTKFVARLYSKDPSNWAVGMANLNNTFLAASYKDALVELCTRQKISPEAYTALMLGITWTHISCQKFVQDKSTMATQARAYFEEYQRLRTEGHKQEVFYNMGRAMHQLSILHLAVHYYKLALNTKAMCPEFDLSRECAYNLALIYTSSGNSPMARRLYQKYLVFE